jgi:uncharacterized protein (TIGR02246 family)
MTQTQNDTIEAFLNRVRQAWDAGDAHAYALQFAEDASYVIFLGEVMFGRARIEETHVDVLAMWQKGTRMVVKAISTRPIDSESVSVVTIGGIGKGQTIPYDKIQTYILHRREGQWECVAFQNTEMSREAKQMYNAI